MEDPGSQGNFTGSYFIDCFDIIERLFLGDWNVNGIVESFSCSAKAEEGDKKYIRLLSVLEQPNHFLSTIQVGITWLPSYLGRVLQIALVMLLLDGWAILKRLLQLEAFYL